MASASALAGAFTNLGVAANRTANKTNVVAKKVRGCLLCFRGRQRVVDARGGERRNVFPPTSCSRVRIPYFARRGPRARVALLSHRGAAHLGSWLREGSPRLDPWGPCASLIFCKNRLADRFSLTSRRCKSLLSQLISTPLFFSIQVSAARAGVRSGKRNLTVRLCSIPFPPLPSAAHKRTTSP